MSSLDFRSSPPALRPRDVAFGVLLAGPPIALLVCLLFGLGRHAGASATLSFGAALALATLPAMGLGAVIRRLGSTRRQGPGVVVPVVATWIWTACVLAATPSFAPGLRSEAARAGAEALVGRFVGPLGEPVVTAAGALAGLLGSDGEAAQPTEPLATTAPPAQLGATREPRAEPTRPRPAPRPVSPAPTSTAPVVLAYRGDGRELDVEVSLDGPDFGERFRMIFDTGASFTTVTPDALAHIDVDIPADAPRVTLNTAGGQIQAPLVLLDAVWMGDVPVEWVTVAACPSCTAPGRSGLLGLNVSSQFHVEIDYDRKRIALEPSPGDRRNDIRPWLELRARGVHHGDERLEFDVTVSSRAPRAIESATVEIDCGGSGYAVEVVGIPARGERSTSLTLPGAERCESFRLDLISAAWVLDRF